MAFEPYLFIGVGKDNHFFTLRETYEHVTYHRGGGDMGGAVVNGVYQGSMSKEIWSFHHFNLSQNPAEAFAKATEAAVKMGLRLDCDGVDDLAKQLNEIKRATADELAERERRAAEQTAYWAAERAATDAQFREVINAGFFPFGRFEGQAFEKAGPQYLGWMVAKLNDFEDGSLNKLIAEKIKADYQHCLLPTPDLDKTYGKIGDKVNFTDLLVIRSAYFDTQYGRMYVTTFITKDAECIVIKTGAFSANVGERVSLKATIKAHERYNGQMQTIIQRPANVVRLDN